MEMKLKREVIDRWVALRQDQLRGQYPDNPNCVYAYLTGMLQGILGDMAMGGTAREIAIERILEELEGY